MNEMMLTTPIIYSGHGHADPKMLIATWIVLSLITLPSFIIVVCGWIKNRALDILEYNMFNLVMFMLFAISNIIGIVLCLANYLYKYL